MWRDVVTVTDAVQAVVLMETSMYTGAVLGVASLLHADFVPDPDQAFAVREQMVLQRLGITLTQSGSVGGGEGSGGDGSGAGVPLGGSQGYSAYAGGGHGAAAGMPATAPGDAAGAGWHTGGGGAAASMWWGGGGGPPPVASPQPAIARSHVVSPTPAPPQPAARMPPPAPAAVHAVAAAPAKATSAAWGGAVSRPLGSLHPAAAPSTTAAAGAGMPVGGMRMRVPAATPLDPDDDLAHLFS